MVKRYVAVAILIAMQLGLPFSRSMQCFASEPRPGDPIDQVKQGAAVRLGIQTGHTQLGGIAKGNASAFVSTVANFGRISFERLSFESVFDITHFTFRWGQTRAYPFSESSHATMLAFLLRQSGCYQFQRAVSTCLGVGVGNINVNTTYNRQDYGSWNYHWTLDWRLDQAFSVELISKYIGKVEQRVDGRESEFYAYLIGSGIAYRW